MIQLPALSPQVPSRTTSSSKHRNTQQHVIWYIQWSKVHAAVNLLWTLCKVRGMILCLAIKSYNTWDEPQHVRWATRRRRRGQVIIGACEKYIAQLWNWTSRRSTKPRLLQSRLRRATSAFASKSLGGMQSIDSMSNLYFTLVLNASS